MNRKTLLVISESHDLRRRILDALVPAWDVEFKYSGSEALHTLQKSRYDLILADTGMTDVPIDTFMENFKTLNMHSEVILLTSDFGSDNWNSLMKMGTYDILAQSAPVPVIKRTFDRASCFLEIKAQNSVLKNRLRELEHPDILIGCSSTIGKIREKAKLASKSDATVLITGESGTGKKTLAREIHNGSGRRTKPFIKISCPSMPGDMLEDELYGTGRGLGERAGGKLALASGGTILLDEIGEMSVKTQAILLQVLEEQERKIKETGGDSDDRIHFIATSSRNLRREMTLGTFNGDLFYALNVIPLHIPSLRERREDIPLLVNHFIERHSNKNNKAPIRLTTRALNKLRNAYWNGNVRELENIIERAVIFSDRREVDEDFFELEDERDIQISMMQKAFKYGSIKEMEKIMILNRLIDTSDNRTQAARSLDISVRTLRNKLREYNIRRKSRSSTATGTAAAPKSPQE